MLQNHHHYPCGNELVFCLNDYCPVTLTLIIMKFFERLVMKHIKCQLPPSLDPLQFVYHPSRSTDDAIITKPKQRDSNNLSLNVDKTQGIVVDCRRMQGNHAPLNINGVHITENLTWSLSTSSKAKKARQRLYFLWRLRKAYLPPPILTTFYKETVESILSSCIIAWFGNCNASDRRTRQRIVRTLFCHRHSNHALH
ncbi:hypothetical protein NFI96_029421, partial [Prochilodus magdalenae]